MKLTSDSEWMCIKWGHKLIQYFEINGILFLLLLCFLSQSSAKKLRAGNMVPLSHFILATILWDSLSQDHPVKFMDEGNLCQGHPKSGCWTTIRYLGYPRIGYLGSPRYLILVQHTTTIPVLHRTRYMYVLCFITLVSLKVVWTTRKTQKNWSLFICS